MSRKTGTGNITGNVTGKFEGIGSESSDYKFHKVFGFVSLQFGMRYVKFESKLAIIF